MASWLRELGDVVYDDTHVLLTRRQYEGLDGYESIGQPTNPSVGRAFRTNARGGTRPAPVGLVVFVEEDPEPGYVLRRGRVPLFVDE